MQTLLEQILDPPLQPVLYKLDETTGKFIDEYHWNKKFSSGPFQYSFNMGRNYGKTSFNEHMMDVFQSMKFHPDDYIKHRHFK